MTAVSGAVSGPIADPRARIGVVHVVDTLNIGGAERVAVNLVNLLPRDRYDAYLCTTRTEGALSSCISPHVGRLKLDRRSRLNLYAVWQFVEFLKARNIRIVHAHGSSLFFCRIATAFASRVALIWHDHYGKGDFQESSIRWIYRIATRGAGVIAVNQTLSDWCRCAIGVPEERVWYIPNLVEDHQKPACVGDLHLPGTPGKRLVCVANLRREKDHPTLLRAIALVDQAGCGAHLFLVGNAPDPDYLGQIRSLITSLKLDHAVTYLGPRQDVAAILDACDVGILSSIFEGLPLALLEYGRAGIAAVCTTVGQCPEVLRNGDAGILVPPGSPVELARAIQSLLTDEKLRRSLGRNFQIEVEECYSPRRVMQQICQVYDTVLERAS